MKCFKCLKKGIGPCTVGLDKIPVSSRHADYCRLSYSIGCIITFAVDITFTSKSEAEEPNSVRHH